MKLVADDNIICVIGRPQSRFHVGIWGRDYTSAKRPTRLYSRGRLSGVALGLGIIVLWGSR